MVCLCIYIFIVYPGYFYSLLTYLFWDGKVFIIGRLVKLSLGGDCLASGTISTGLNPVMIIIGLVVGLIVLNIFNGMTLLGANISANLASGTSTLAQTLPIVSIGVFIAIIGLALKIGGKV